MKKKQEQKMYNRLSANSLFQKGLTYGANPFIQWILIATVILGGGILAVFWHYAVPSDELLRLQYNVYFGTSIYERWWGVYALSGVGMIFFVTNFCLSFILYNINERMGSYVVLGGGLITHIALAVAAVSIVLNNFV